MVAPCLFGLESILKFEISQIGGKNISAENGRVKFSGDESVLIKANLWLRTAERILIVLKEFSAKTFEELFDNVGEIPFESYVGEADKFPVKGWSLDSKLASVSSCQSIIKKSIVKRLEKAYNIELFPETGTFYQVSFSIHKDMATIMLDTTGDPLYKRGYRQLTNEAPIRETLAAGIVDFARVSEKDKLYDITCGSGTLLIESAQRVLNIAPGLNRGFSAESWEILPKYLWDKEKSLARKEIKQDVNFKAYGSDIDPSVIKIAKRNAANAGVASNIEFTVKDLKDFVPSSPSIVISNPPYGERLEADIEELYQTMGNVMKKEKNVQYYIIAPSEGFEKSFDRKADRRRKLYNGMIECQLYMYYK